MERTKFQSEKKLVLEYIDAIEKCSVDEVEDVLKKYVSEDYVWEGVFPFMEQIGASATAEVFWKPLKSSLKHMQIRKDIFFAGVCRMDDKVWVMNMGQIMGNFDKDYMNIPRSCKMQHLRYGEWICVENGKITKSSMHVDLLGFMDEVGIRPLPLQTGKFFVYPGPKEHNGLLFEDAPYEKAKETERIVDIMMGELNDPAVNSKGTPEDELRVSWTEDMIWYGPCGVGASYTIERYQKQHQIPFRTNLTDRVCHDYSIYFAEGDFACYVMSMDATSTGGWLGMTGGHKSIFLSGDTDVYYCKDGKISENWCFIDIPYWLNEQGLNIFERTLSIINPQI